MEGTRFGPQGRYRPAFLATPLKGVQLPLYVCWKLPHAPYLMKHIPNVKC